MVCLLVALLCACESCIVLFFSSGGLGVCHGFPLVHGTGYFVPVQGLAENPLAQAFPESYNCPFSIQCPSCCKGEAFACGNVGVDVPANHDEFH